MCKIVQSCCLCFLQNKTTKASKRPFRGIKRARERAHIVSIHYTILQISKLLSGDMVKLFQSWADLEVGLGVVTIRSHPLQPLWTPHEIYTTQFSLLCVRVKHCFETGQVFFLGGGGLGLMLYLLKLFHLHPSNPQWSGAGGYRDIPGFLGCWFKTQRLVRSIFFFFQILRDLHFHEHFELGISSKCDIKAENSSTLCKFHKGRSRKGLWRWDLMLTIRGSPNPLPFCLLLCLKF